MVEGKPLSGGQKQLWLRNHRDEVLNYYREHGFDETCTHFNMEISTLERFLTSNKQRREFSAVDKAIMMAQIAIASNRELKAEIKYLRQETSTFKEDVARRITQILINPAVESIIKLPETYRLKNTNDSEIDLP